MGNYPRYVQGMAGDAVVAALELGFKFKKE